MSDAQVAAIQRLANIPQNYYLDDIHWKENDQRNSLRKYVDDLEHLRAAYFDEHPADEDAPPTSEWVAAALGQVPIVDSPYGCDTYVLVRNLLYVRCCGPYTTLDDWTRFAEIQTIRTKRRFLELARAFEIPLKTT